MPRRMAHVQRLLPASKLDINNRALQGRKLGDVHLLVLVG